MRTTLSATHFSDRTSPPMASYPLLSAFVTRVQDGAERGAWDKTIAYLTRIWLSEYQSGSESGDIVLTTSHNFAYLFDIAEQRLIAAFGVSRGRHSGPRPSARMAGHPLGGGPGYHRGHAIAHTLGGGTDINLVPQFGSVNIGSFRVLEKRAVAKPGSFYFSYWSYPPDGGQRPRGVDQGLLVPGGTATVLKQSN